MNLNKICYGFIFGLSLFSLQAQENWKDTIEVENFHHSQFDTIFSIDKFWSENALEMSLFQLIHPVTKQFIWANENFIIWSEADYWLMIREPLWDEFEMDSIGWGKINGIDGPVLLAHYFSVQNGARGGSVFEKIQLWDLYNKQLLLSGTTRNKFEWFSSDVDSYDCRRSFAFSEGEFIIEPAVCSFPSNAEAQGHSQEEQEKKYQYRYQNGLMINQNQL
jgi:hypothetical protein